MKRALYFFPLNPADKNSGSISRALSLLQYFKSRDIQVDFVSKQHWGNYTSESIAAFEQAGLANSITVLRRKPVKKNPLIYFLNYKLKHIFFERKLHIVKGSIPNHTTLHLRNQFDALLQQKTYDYIIISYAYWADLVKDNLLTGNAIKIIDTHDFLSSQHQGDKGFERGAAIADELRRLSFFDQIWAISAEETYFFRQFFKEKVSYIPMTMDEPEQSTINILDKKYDLIYVATDNPHNLVSAKWFFEDVYPLLPQHINICVIGTILGHIPETLSRIIRVPFAEELDSYYNQAKIALCPMLTGTGVKIKVVEAMAHGLPVVCTAAGVDGMPDKTNNGCLVSNQPAVFATYIVQLLNDPVLYRQQSEAGKDCFIRNFETRHVYTLIDNALSLAPDAKS